jgi:hypothetical protein
VERRCKYHPAKRCYHSSCSVFDSASGSVSVCFLHPHPSGLLMRKKVVFAPSVSRS